MESVVGGGGGANNKVFILICQKYINNVSDVKRSPLLKRKSKSGSKEEGWEMEYNAKAARPPKLSVYG